MKAKRLLLGIAIFVAALAGPLRASAQTVTGYVHKVLAGGYTLIANPFDTTNNTFAGLFSHLPPGTQFLKFDKAKGDFASFAKVGFGSGWSPPSAATATLNPGEAAFVLLQGGDFTNTFAGEVLQGILTNKLSSGYNLVGSMVPDSGSITQLALRPPNGSQILKWNTEIQDYDVYTTVTFGAGWSPSVPTFAVGEGFFVYASAPFEWVRSYTAP